MSTTALDLFMLRSRLVLLLVVVSIAADWVLLSALFVQVADADEVLRVLLGIHHLEVVLHGGSTRLVIFAWGCCVASCLVLFCILGSGGVILSDLSR